MNNFKGMYGIIFGFQANEDFYFYETDVRIQRQDFLSVERQDTNVIFLLI